MTGEASRGMRARFEREVIALAHEHGLIAVRGPLSNESGDTMDGAEITPGFAPERPWRGECKRRKALPDWLTTALDGRDFVALRADRHEGVAIIPLRALMELLQ
jgi:hypothetical protein